MLVGDSGDFELKLTVVLEHGRLKTKEDSRKRKKNVQIMNRI